MSKHSDSPEWQIQESLRWQAILGFGFGVPALLTFIIATAQHVTYSFTVVFSLVAGLFFWWDWRKHHIPSLFLRSVEVFTPVELQEGAVASCEVRLPSSSQIRIRNWSFSVSVVELDDSVEHEDFLSYSTEAFCEMGLTREGSLGTRVGDHFVLTCEILVPKQPDLQANHSPLLADVTVWLRLAGFGTWRRRSRVPLKQSRTVT
jgi:hypothetical protein